MIGLYFVVAILFVLTLASDRAVLNKNDVFSILVVSTKKRYSSFLKKVFVFQKIWIKVNVLKTFKIFTDCHIKTCRSLKRRAILKIPSTVFRRIYALSAGLKMKPPKKKKAFSSVKTKTNPNFAVRLAERSNDSFSLSIWWITFFKHLYYLARNNRMYRT